MTNDENSEKMQIKAWGDTLVTGNKEYLSYIIKKENFKGIPIENNLNEFDFLELVYNQKTGKITLDCFNKENEKIIKTNFEPYLFFKIISDIIEKTLC